jgi:pyruvate,water dikinase
MAAGFPVPEGFCITSEAYREHARQSDILASQATEKDEWPFEQTYQNLLGVELNPVLVDAVLESYRRLTNLFPGPVAVRSSATAEDLLGHSFAGLYGTVLDVRDESSLLDAIRRCWASYWSQEAVFYRQHIRIGHAEHSMAVLVQMMVQSRTAGVIFTQAPGHQGQSALAVEFVAGSGEALVSGTARASRYIIDRETKHPLDQSRQGTGLDPSLLNRLVSLGLEIERYQGGPQDIEWCVDEAGRIWILQTRPVAGVADVRPVPEVDRSTKLTRAYDEPFSTLGCDLALRRHQRWVESINDYHKTRFKSEMQVINGILYYEPSWRSAKGLLQLWMASWKFIRWLSADRIHREYTEIVVPAHLARLEEIDQADISGLDSVTLMSRFDASIENYLDLQYISLPANGIATTSADLLDRLCRLWFRKGDTIRASDLLSGLDNLTVERDLALHRLGQALGEVLTPGNLAKMDYPTLSELQCRDNSGQRVSDALRTFFDRYGYVWADRYPRDPGWEVDQDAAVASLAHVSQLPPSAGLPAAHARQKEYQAQIIEEATQRLSARGLLSLRWTVFRWVLRRAERFFPSKEDRNHYVYQSVMVIRKYAREIGRRLAAQGVFESPEDIFFLTWEEIREALAGQGEVSVLRRQVKERRYLYQQSRRQWVRPRASVRLLEPRVWNGDENTSTEYIGEPCSPGVASGPARLVNGLGELFRVQPGDIMVCTEMRPAWSPVLARAGGVVVEVGSLLSHGATLAREYGVPAVFNIPGITQIVRDGSQVVVDGNRGTVSIDEIAACNT